MAPSILLGMCIYIHAYMHTCIQTYLHTHIHAHIHTHSHIHAYILAYIRTYLHIASVCWCCITIRISRSLYCRACTSETTNGMHVTKIGKSRPHPCLQAYRAPAKELKSGNAMMLYTCIYIYIYRYIYK